jgi:phospholipid/cholesterol/gamma-HCH transport system substrate-binding protein
MNFKEMSPELKVGIFAIVVITIIAWATVRVSDRTSVSGSGYTLSVVFDNATGLKKKAPVELAGVQIGVVKDIELVDSSRAKVELLVSEGVKLSEGTRSILRTRGFLGETYVEIVPGAPELPTLGEDGEILFSARTGDVNSLVGQFTLIADDIKHVTASLRTMVGKDQNAPINRIVENLETFTEAIKNVTLRNEDNIDRVTANLAAMTDQLREIIVRGQSDVEESMDRIASITRKIDEGRGTIGRLVNDEETVDKLNEAVDNLNETLGGFKRLEMEVGYHVEYLTQSEDFKHYVSLGLMPSPDKAFLFDIVSDPDPRPTFMQRDTAVTVGGTTTNVTTETATINREQIKFSAQLAKKFYDFTLRGGIIESTGGVGLDYDKGPLGIHFSAFDLSTRFDQKPHLKLFGNVNITDNFYMIGGADDMLRENNKPDWFVGAGFRMADDDVKSVIGLGGSALIK